MKSRDLSSLMWGEALAMLDRAERLQRRFFTHAPTLGSPAWEPPVDIVEAEDGLKVQVALPGVPAEAIAIAADPRGVTVSALRGFPSRDRGARIHRLEIPYGRFERRIAIDMGEMKLEGKTLQDGVLTLTLRRRESK